jgi:hypothetical protein
LRHRRALAFLLSAQPFELGERGLLLGLLAERSVCLRHLVEGDLVARVQGNRFLEMR